MARKKTISILLNVSKIYGKCLNKHLEEYTQALLSKYQSGFQKRYNVINALLPMIEKWRKSLDEDGAFGALLIDISKAFDSLPHELLIAKLHVYGVDIPSWRGSLKCSIPGPLLFNIFLCDLFQFFSDLDVTIYTDDNTPHSTKINLNKALQDLGKMSNTLFKWFTDNLLKANP